MRFAQAMLLVAAALGACRSRGAAHVCEDCNLLVVALTNLRQDHLGIFGYQRDTTPAIDAFFAEGIRFETTFAAASWTLPVAASLMSSLDPYRHGVLDRYGEDSLAEEVVTLAEVLSAAGYRTGAFTGGGEYHRRFGLAQGFETYVDEAAYMEHGVLPPGVSASYLGIDRLLPAALRWVAARDRRPFFLFLQGYDLHCPFTPRPPYRGMFDPGYAGGVDFARCLWTEARAEPRVVGGKRVWPVLSRGASGQPVEVLLDERDVAHLVALYDEEVAQTDQAFGELIDALQQSDVLDETVVVLLAEHGDLLGDHGRFMRSGPLIGTFYQEVLQFPLLVRHPRLAGHRDVGALVQTVDLLPTWLDLLAIADPAAPGRQGRSLASVLFDRGAPGGDQAFAGSRFVGCGSSPFAGIWAVESVRDREWKLVRETVAPLHRSAPPRITRELFHLTADPGERRDRAEEEPAIVTSLEGALENRFGEVRDRELPARCRGEAISDARLPR